jgi:protein-disulfide isomerase
MSHSANFGPRSAKGLCQHASEALRDAGDQNYLVFEIEHFD